MPQEPEHPKSSPSEHPSPEKRFVQRSLQAIARWSPLGGSSFAFASFLLRQEWVTAVFLFPVTIVSGVWAAYSKNFVERLSEIYAERAKKDADAFVTWMDSLNEALMWQFSDFDAKYLKQQADLCEEYTTEGYKNALNAMLEEVFVPLELNMSFADNSNLTPQISKSPEGLKIWDLIQKSRKNRTFRQMVILKHGGFGKTTLLRHISLIYGKGKQGRYKAPKLIPFLLYLRDWGEDILKEEPLPSLPELITKYYLPSLSQSQPLNPPPKWAENHFLAGNALVMLDGFDELAERHRQRLSYWISQQMKEYNRSVFILTSRPAGYEDYLAKGPTARLFIQEFSQEQQKCFVERWYLCQESCARKEKYAAQAKKAAKKLAKNLLIQLTRPELQELAKNPLLLNMLVTFHRFAPNDRLPNRKIELYKNICKVQLEDRPKARGIPMLLNFDESQILLQKLALMMVNQNLPTITAQQAINFFQKQEILEEEAVDPASFLRQIVQVSELLVEREQGELEFPHLSFQGYFAATYLAKHREKGRSIVLQNWDKSWWRESILFYTADLPPKALSPILSEASKLSENAAQLAYDCLKEYRRPDKLDSALEQELKVLIGDLQVLLYRTLEEYLENRHWQEADNETYRLMINTVGKEEGQWFAAKELVNFPSEELREIDRLWTKHSDGKFGFSVQKKIYQECGGIFDGKCDKKAWKSLCQKNGWMKHGSYEEVKYDISSPLGHLPALPHDLEGNLVSRFWIL